jgi:hypothetical protein
MSNSIFWNSTLWSFPWYVYWRLPQSCLQIDIRLAGRHLSVVGSMLPKQSKGNERTKMVVVRECLRNQENMFNENASTRWFTKLIIGTKDLLFVFEYIHTLKKSNAFANYCVRWKWMSDQGVNDNDWHYSMKNRFFFGTFFFLVQYSVSKNIIFPLEWLYFCSLQFLFAIYSLKFSHSFILYECTCG